MFESQIPDAKHCAPKIKYGSIRVNIVTWERLISNTVVCVEFIKRHRSDKKTHFTDNIDIL